VGRRGDTPNHTQAHTVYTTNTLTYIVTKKNKTIQKKIYPQTWEDSNSKLLHETNQRVTLLLTHALLEIQFLFVFNAAQLYSQICEFLPLLALPAVLNRVKASTWAWKWRSEPH
jgi:hypothetical protein